PFRPEEWPLAREAAALLAAHGAGPQALVIYQTLALTGGPTSEAHKALLAEARSVADAVGDRRLSLDFSRQLDEPASPPVK
ncbi:MAG: hypothetical protein JWQ62_698, partial [Lacunisphaera sp.]|nr:hypothetical protein [Lacunisphaera sp.]